ncbi:recombinase family protein [Lachnospiraceae bacterium 45-W7]
MAAPIRNVQKIESRNSLNPAMPTVEHQKRRVAAYARVSTDSDEQLSSYEAQVDFYTRYIKNNPEWEFVNVYTDEGISGTNTKKREGFNRMVTDALNGKIDLILTKSISRFARNTVDTLTTVRKLKEKNVEVYFEKENIYTLDAKGEVMITIMSSLAQEESRSISENVTWGKRHSMEEGRFSLAYKYFLGYKKGEDGILEIVEEEAQIVRKIYQMFLDGNTVRTIADYLTGQSIPTPRGKEKWSVSTVTSILTNEKYKGDALLQKTYTADFLTKKSKKNNGEMPQYYIKNSHPAIIDPATFDLVQEEVERRRPNRRQLHKSSPFNSKIVCGECGGYYGRKVWHSNSKHRKQIWRCNRKYEAETVCATPNIDEPILEAAFVEAFSQMLSDKEQHIAQLEKMLPILADASGLEKQLDDAQNQHAELINALRRYMEENTRQIQNQEEYNRRFSEMDADCKKAEEQIAQLQKEILAQSGKREQVNRCLVELHRCGDSVEKFDPHLWNAMVESVTVCADKRLVFLFRDETKITIQMPETKTVPYNSAE